MNTFIDRMELKEREGKNLMIGRMRIRVTDGSSFYKNKIKWFRSPGVCECVSIMCICVCVCVYLCGYVHVLSVCAFVCACVHLCMCMSMYVCVFLLRECHYVKVGTDGR